MGSFFGALLGGIFKEILKDPEARMGLIMIFREAMNDTAAYGGNNDVAQSEFKRMWNTTFGSTTGNGGVHPGKTEDQGGASGSK